MEITLTNLQKQHRVPQAFILAWLPRCVKAIQNKKIDPRFKDLLQKDLSVVFVDSKTIQNLNKQYRGKNTPTDILSFSDLFEEQLGELVLCPEVIVAQARRQGWSQRHEYAYMLLHGVLHLLGYDHEIESEAKSMFELQDALFAALMP